MYAIENVSNECNSILNNNIINKFKEENKTMLESLDNSSSAIDNNKILSESINDNNHKWVSENNMYFTLEEVEQFSGYYSDIIKEDLGTQFNPKSWNRKLCDLELKLQMAEDPDEIDNIKQQIIDLGWNPEIEYTTENRIKAKHRLEKIYTERYKNIEYINISSLVENFIDDNDYFNESINNELNPISVVVVKGGSRFSSVISKATDSQFSHAALCLDNDFNNLYSFNLVNNVNNVGGFSVEDIEKYNREGRLAVFTFFVSRKMYDKIKEKIDILINSIKNTSYSVFNILTLPFKHININFSNSMICSQFVDATMKMANLNITNKNSSKVVPGDLYNAFIGENSKIYKIFDGIAKDFNIRKSTRYINKILKNAKIVDESNIDLDMVFSYPYILESKLPLQIKDNGDILLTNKFIDFDSEYASSHKLLLSYDKANNIEGMKYELARLYYMNYILERKLYHNKYLKNKEKNIKTRARILNDFKKYMSVILSKDPNFNFSKYYEESIFYPHTIEINSSTAIAFKNILKCIL